MEFYEPDEDTFFLIELLESVKGKRKILEIGCNDGFVLANYPTKDDGLLVGIDVSLLPLLNKRDKRLELLQADGGYLPFRRNSFEIVFFNPPYLPSNKLEDITVDGGKDGIEITMKFLRSSKKVIKSNGIIIFIASTFSNIKKLEKEFQNMNFKIIKRKERRLFFESLIGYYLKHKSQ